MNRRTMKYIGCISILLLTGCSFAGNPGKDTHVDMTNKRLERFADMRARSIDELYASKEGMPPLSEAYDFSVCRENSDRVSVTGTMAVKGRANVELAKLLQTLDELKSSQDERVRLFQIFITNAFPTEGESAVSTARYSFPFEKTLLFCQLDGSSHVYGTVIDSQASGLAAAFREGSSIAFNGDDDATLRVKYVRSDFIPPQGFRELSFQGVRFIKADANILEFGNMEIFPYAMSNGSAEIQLKGEELPILNQVTDWGLAFRSDDLVIDHDKPVVLERKDPEDQDAQEQEEDMEQVETEEETPSEDQSEAPSEESDADIPTDPSNPEPQEPTNDEPRDDVADSNPSDSEDHHEPSTPTQPPSNPPRNEPKTDKPKEEIFEEQVWNLERPRGEEPYTAEILSFQELEDTCDVGISFPIFAALDDSKDNPEANNDRFFAYIKANVSGVEWTVGQGAIREAVYNPRGYYVFANIGVHRGDRRELCGGFCLGGKDNNNAHECVPLERNKNIRNIYPIRGGTMKLQTNGQLSLENVEILRIYGRNEIDGNLQRLLKVKEDTYKHRIVLNGSLERVKDRYKPSISFKGVMRSHHPDEDLSKNPVFRYFDRVSSIIPTHRVRFLKAPIWLDKNERPQELFMQDIYNGGLRFVANRLGKFNSSDVAWYQPEVFDLPSREIFASVR